LLTLGTVIAKLSERKKGEKIGHLPYRDSKLTRILEPTLGGNSRIAVICTMTPAASTFEESNNTLKFASRAKKVTNKAKYGTDQDKALIMKYRQEIDQLRQKLEEAQTKETVLAEIADKSETSSVSSVNSANEHTEQRAEENKEVAELKEQLQEQEALRVSFEEKIKQLTKLILVSTSVNQQEQESRSRAITGTASKLMQKLRSKTHSMSMSTTDKSKFRGSV
jgi:centromeric protein E